jgi:hypothetical protein
MEDTPMDVDIVSVDQDIYSNEAVMDSNELRELFAKLGLTYSECELSTLSQNNEFYTLVHTGRTKSSANSGQTNHWLACYGPFIFDSYGKYNLWHLPPGYEPVETIPGTLQEYGTNVCGMYCAAYIDFCNNSDSDGSDDLGREFCIAYGFGKNRKENDTIILSWYEGIMGKEINGNS